METLRKSGIAVVAMLCMVLLGWSSVAAQDTSDTGDTGVGAAALPQLVITVSSGSAAGIYIDQSVIVPDIPNQIVVTASNGDLFRVYNGNTTCSGASLLALTTGGTDSDPTGRSFRVRDSQDPTVLGPCYFVALGGFQDVNATGTAAPTNTPTETPTETPANTATNTSTTEPTATSTDIPVENGAVAVTIVTEDGSEIPSNTVVCLDLDCRNLDDVIAAAAPSGTTVTFEDVTPGDHVVSVTVNGALAASETVTVAPGATTNVTIVLPAADATPNIIVNPPGGGSGQPVDPDDGDNDGGSNGDDGSDDGGSTDGGSSGGGNGSGAAPVTSLPSTGTGDETPANALIVLLGGVLLIAIAGGLALRGRRTS